MTNNLLPEMITPEWTFGGKWNPELVIGPKVIKYIMKGNSVLFFFDEKITIVGNPVLKSGNNTLFSYKSGAGSDTINFISDKILREEDLINLSLINDSKITGTKASINERFVFNEITKH